MEIEKLVEEIGAAYVRETVPEQLPEFSEYMSLLKSDLETGAPASDSDRFGPGEAALTLVAPLVVGVLSNWLYDLIRRRPGRVGDHGQRELDPAALAAEVLTDADALASARESVARQTGRHEEVREITVYAVRYIERRYGVPVRPTEDEAESR